jgi:D-alanyl-D-alanine carboxypeptidase (penicillin-binding protein 5/6)
MNWLFAAVLALQVTGVWGWISPQNRVDLTNLALGHSAIGAAAPAAAVTPTLSGLALPVTVGGATAAPAIPDGVAAYALDVSSGTVLYAAGATVERPIASTTKLMTALVILGVHDPNERVIVPTLPAYPSDAELIGLVPGESYSVLDLAQLMLVASDNDAADSLAIIDSGSVSAFTAKMNAKAAEWGITGAHFASASGLVDTGNTVSAEALAHIALLALRNPLIRETVLKQSVSVTSGGGRQIIQNTTDTLLASGQFYGIKTGYTGAAGQCFVGLTKITGHEVITVVLGSGDRFGDTQQLASWISQNYQWF